jgi:hypothetical protein
VKITPLHSRGGSFCAPPRRAADGTASDYTFTLDNYFAAPGPENDAIATLSYVNDSSPASNGGVAGRSHHTVYVFYASVPIIPGREVTAVTLPPNGANPPTGRHRGCTSSRSPWDEPGAVPDEAPAKLKLKDGPDNLSWVFAGAWKAVIAAPTRR